MRDEMFGVLHGATDTVYRVNAAGEFDVSSLPCTCLAVEGYRQTSYRHVVVDLTDVTFVDSGGARFLLDLAKVSGERGGRVVVLNPQRPVLRVLALLGLTEELDVYGVG